MASNAISTPGPTALEALSPTERGDRVIDMQASQRDAHRILLFEAKTRCPINLATVPNAFTLGALR